MIYKINPDIIWKDADGVVYILQPTREEIHALNETGSFIWRLLSKGNSLEQVQTKLLREYSVTAREASVDLQHFVEKYIREKFLIRKQIKRRSNK